ncbi:hypothetical protein TY91_07465 [Secundilactobacillus collinoides]|uniref:Uncharacterized protein n=2 Tax=Secundilactobacillus collinoides TaxID=33960 RepID=A0A0R2BDI5_SECCO|nr:hypothetical protein FC82_GL000461 [Secundilactobacillus collinoides DSM 20515 = JCM 1123]KZL41080.1 hypothetical protein TY91_07465 [Secundilactobacillus collinoides]
MDDCHCSRPFIIEAKSMIFSVGPMPSSLPAVGYSFELAQLAIMFFCTASNLRHSPTLVTGAYLTPFKTGV